MTIKERAGPNGWVDFIERIIIFEILVKKIVFFSVKPMSNV